MVMAALPAGTSSQQLRHTDATHLPNAGVERVIIKVLFGHERSANTPIYAHVGQERMEQVVGRL